MSGLVIKSPQTFSCQSIPHSLSKITQPRHSIEACDRRFMSFKNSPLALCNFPKMSFRCSSTGENGSKAILEAFFLGKAVAEALSERAESVVGELLSTIGKFQAEQQKQVQDFQEEVFEKARRAKEEAAREAVGARLVPGTPATEVREVVNGGTSTEMYSPPGTISSAAFASSDESNSADEDTGY